MSDPQQWIRRRVAQAVEASEVSAELLLELDANIREHEEHAATVDDEARLRELAEMFGVTEAQMVLAIEKLSARLGGAEQFVKEVAEIWLKHHQWAYQRKRRRRRHAGGE